MKKSVVTIGVFDGVHIGHQAVIKKVVMRSRAIGARAIAITFDPHPMKLLSASHFVPSLISLKHRIRLIKELGIDSVTVLKFDRKMADITAEKFVKNILIKRFNTKEVFVGEDFRFGAGAEADANILKEIGRAYAIKVNIVKDVKKDGAVVSSSIIRQFVVRGEIDMASGLLGRSYSILGTVVGGAKLARVLGYPTANLNPHHEAVPPSGVYAVKIIFNKKTFKGVMNIGVKPTFYDHGHDKEPAIEVHIFSFHSRIYGKDLEVLFVKKLRDEKKFKTQDELISQIKKDVKSSKS